MLIFDAFDGPKAFFSDRRAQKNGFKNVSSHKPFSEYDETVLGYQKLKKSVRGLLCREKLENGKKSTVRDMEGFCTAAGCSTPCRVPNFEPLFRTVVSSQ